MPFYRRMLGDLARARPDLSYKFKSSSVPLNEGAQPGSPAAIEAAQGQSGPAAEPTDLSYTDGTTLPGRPTHPFEIRVMLNQGGNATSIRCYKGLIYDPPAGKDSSTRSLLVTQNTVTKRVNIRGGRGSSSSFIEGEQRDFLPSNHDMSGPELHKYVDFQDPIQTTWAPNFRYPDTGGGGGGPSTKSAGRDSDPVMTTVITPTRSTKIGKDAFTSSDDKAYFEWPYSSDAYIMLYCYDDGDPATRKWGLYLNGTLTDSDLGKDGFAIFVGSVDGRKVTQHFKSDIVIKGGKSDPAHPFKVRPNMSTGNLDTTVWEVYPGTVNNIEMIGGTNDGEEFSAGTFYLSDGDMVWLACKYDPMTKKFPSQVIMGYGSLFPEDDNEYSYIKLAKRQGGQLVQFITGSLWGDRIQLGAGSSEKALYYYAQV